MSFFSRYAAILPRYLIALALVFTFGTVFLYSQSLLPIASKNAASASAKQFSYVSEIIINNTSSVDTLVSQSPSIPELTEPQGNVDRSDPFDITREVFHGTLRGL